MTIINKLRQAWRGARSRVCARLYVLRRWSVQLTAVQFLLAGIALVDPGTVQAVWNTLPPEILDRLPRGVTMSVPLILSLAALVASFIKQEKTDG